MDNDGWVRDQNALDTVIALKGIKVGDEVDVGDPGGFRCFIRETVYVVTALDVGPEHPVAVDYGPSVHRRHVLGWRPKRPKPKS